MRTSARGEYRGNAFGRTRCAAAIVVLCVVAPRVALAGCDVAPMGSLAFGERIRDVEVVGDFAYLAAGWDGLAIVDVSDPAAMQMAGTLDLGVYAHDVEVVGDVAYVAASDLDGLAGLYAIGVDDPALPTQVGNVGPSFAQVFVESTLAYAIDPSSGLHIIDVSVPSSPSTLGVLDLPGAESDIALVGNLAFITVSGDDTVSGVRIVDVSDPTSPIETSSVATDDRLPFDIDAAAGIAVVPAIGQTQRGLITLDLAAVGGPVETAFLAQPNARDVQLLGQRAYFAFGSDPNFGGDPGGLRVIDISNPATPVVVGAADTSPNEAAGLEVVSEIDGEWVYVSLSGSQAGLSIFRVSDCPSVVSAGMSDTVPITLDVPIEFDLLGSASVDVANIDVASLTFGPLGAGALTTPGLEPVVQDSNGDGYDDLVLYFQTGGAGLAPGAQQACLEGLLGGQDFLACDWLYFDEPPVANIYTDLEDDIAPLTASFSGLGSFDPEGSPLTYEWQFSDGHSSNRRIAWRDFALRTSLQVTLTVTDIMGQQGVLTTDFEIYVDSDGDGIHDDLEFDTNGNPIDTDGDGFPDHLDRDSDGDRLDDQDEDWNRDGLLDPVHDLVFETDRLITDTDGDGFTDHQEVHFGSNPRDALDFPGMNALPALGPWSSLLALLIAAVGHRRLR